MQTKPNKSANPRAFYNPPGQLGGKPHWSEREGIVTGKLGFGSPSWARGISKPFGKVTPNPIGIGCVNSKVPECSGPVLYPTGSQSEPMVIPHPAGKTVAPASSGFDESRHAIKVARVTQDVQSKLAKAFAKAGPRRKRQNAPKAQETAKERVLGIKEIPINEGYVMRVPEFLKREEVRSDNGATVPRCKVERVDPVTWTPPSSGGRAGIVARYD